MFRITTRINDQITRISKIIIIKLDKNTKFKFGRIISELWEIAKIHS